jgi:GTP pyrophosphokinase
MNAENSSLADTQTETNTQVATDAATADQTLPQRYGALEGENAELVAQAVDWVTQQSSDQAQRVPLLLDIAQRLSADPIAASALVLYLGVSSTPAESDAQASGTENQQAMLEAFPENVRELLDSLTQLRTYEAQVEANTVQHAERLRRLLLALAKDLRVVLMALCWQLFCLREAISAEREEQQRLAEETFQIHAPLANRLGVWQLKWELEDLAFRFRDPEQ